MCPVERHKVAFLNIFESIGLYNPNFWMIHVIIIKMSNQILQFKNTDQKYVHSTNLIILTHIYDVAAYPILCHDPVIRNMNNNKSVKLSVDL